MVPLKIITDGSLLAECQMRGPVRFGMHRVAEDLNRHLLRSASLDIYFANSIYSGRYHDNLKKYLNENYPGYAKKIVSSFPYLNPQVPKVSKTTDRYFQLIAPPVQIRHLDQYDLFFSYYYPFSSNVLRSSVKKCITLLDIIPLRMSGYSKAEINTTQKVIESIVPNFAVAISEYSKMDLCDFDKRVDPKRIFAAPLAASPEMFFVNTDKEKWMQVKKKYQLPDRYFLSVSSIDKRKNLPHLIKSFNKFILQENPADLYLVLTGNTTYGESILHQLGISSKVRDRIVLAKSIANNDLSVVYSNAECFFFMSIYEGFGLPALEAMQCGTPVVTSNATSLPEVVGNAGIMLDPLDEDALCDAMGKMYSNEEMRKKYSMMGLSRSKQFSWQKCADEYESIFKKIVTT